MDIPIYIHTHLTEVLDGDSGSWRSRLSTPWMRRLSTEILGLRRWSVVLNWPAKRIYMVDILVVLHRYRTLKLLGALLSCNRSPNLVIALLHPTNSLNFFTIPRKSLFLFFWKFLKILDQFLKFGVIPPCFLPLLVGKSLKLQLFRKQNRLCYLWHLLEWRHKRIFILMYIVWFKQSLFAPKNTVLGTSGSVSGLTPIHKDSPFSTRHNILVICSCGDFRRGIFFKGPDKIVQSYLSRVHWDPKSHQRPILSSLGGFHLPFASRFSAIYQF